MDKVIAFQGVPGAYSHLACSFVMPKAQTLACSSFSEMVFSVQRGDADFAMVPVENSTAGRVADIHHILPESGLFIIGEHYQPVNHKLLAIKGAQLSDITEVHSHEQGLAQCRKSLEKLEQLRALEAGMSLGVGVVDNAPGGVDTQEDLDAVRARWSQSA